MLIPEFFDFASLVERPKGGWLCAGCGRAIDWPGVCSPCAEQFDLERSAHMATDAIATIPHRFRWATFDAVELAARCPSDAISKARRAVHLLADGKTRVLLLVGQAGSGKTSLACATMRELLCERIGRTARFVSSLALSRARADSALGRIPALVDDSFRASMLVLDDLGQEVHREVVQEVIHARHNADVPIVVTTGFEPQTFADRYGAGTARRLTERAVLIPMEVTR